MELEFEGYIFDCDGTLTDSMPLHAVAWEQTMAKYGVEFGKERCYSMGGMPTVKIIEILADENGVELDAEAIAAEKEVEFFKNIAQLQPVHAVIDVLNACVAAGKKVAVASGSNRESVSLQLKQLELADLFSVIVTAEDTEKHKPEPDVFLKAASLIDVEPSECVVYEDSDLGIQAAKSAGMSWVDIRQM